MTITPWTDDDLNTLRDLHGLNPISKIAEILGRTKGSIRGKITSLGLAKKSLWTQEEELVLINAYMKAGGGFVDLLSVAKSLGRDKSNVCRKAKLLGMEMNASRQKVADRKPPKPNLFSCEKERRSSQSLRMSSWIKENGHPKGMLGKRHTDAVREVLSASSKAAHANVSDEEMRRRAEKAHKTKERNGTSGPPKIPRGTWMAGWREIGGKRNYYRSRWEANYARYLEWLKSTGNIVDWQYEPETFWFEAIRRGVRSYKPDFRVWENNGSSCLHEVKGWMDSRSKTTLSRMKKYHPNEKIILIDGPQYRSIRLKVMRLVDGWEDNKRDTHA